jgi:hypothetical protein
MPTSPPAPTVATDLWVQLQTWLDSHVSGETATLPAGTYRCDHRLRLNADINFVGGTTGAILTRLPAYVGTMEAATTNTVTDSEAGWTVNEHTGKYISITSGGRRGIFKKIQNNTATVLTTDSLGTAPAAGDTFQIISNSGAAIGDTTARNDCFIELVDRSNCTIGNIHLVGVLGFFFSNIIEGQHAFNLLGCQNCTIHDCTVVGVAGDGISENPGIVNKYCVGTTSYNNLFTNIGRQGYTITAGQDITCYDSEWNFCGRSWIDIEPPSANQWPVASATDTTVTVNVVVTSGTVASAAAKSITASGVTWTPHQYANRYLRLTSGAFAGTTLRPIDENTVDTLSFKNSGAIPAPGDTFDIQYEWVYEVGWFGKGHAEPVFREVVSVDGQSTFTFAEVNPDPPAADTIFYVTKGGIARATFTDITLTAITNNVLASGNANGIFCDDVTLERVTVTDNKLVIGFGHTNRHPKRLTVKDCVGIGAYASGPAVLYVDGVVWHNNSAAYQNRDDAPTRFTGCTNVDYITDELANIQMDLHTDAWVPVMRVSPGTYEPELLSTAYDNIIVPDQDVGVYIAAGNTLLAVPGQTFTIADTNTAPQPTIALEEGATLGGWGTADEYTELFGDVVVTDGEQQVLISPTQGGWG